MKSRAEDFPYSNAINDQCQVCDVYGKGMWVSWNDPSGDPILLLGPDRLINNLQKTSKSEEILLGTTNYAFFLWELIQEKYGSGRRSTKRNLMTLKIATDIKLSVGGGNGKFPIST